MVWTVRLHKTIMQIRITILQFSTPHFTTTLLENAQVQLWHFKSLSILFTVNSICKFTSIYNNYNSWIHLMLPLILKYTYNHCLTELGITKLVISQIVQQHHRLMKWQYFASTYLCTYVIRTAKFEQKIQWIHMLQVSLHKNRENSRKTREQNKMQNGRVKVNKKLRSMQV